MNSSKQKKRFSKCIKGMKITSKNGELVTDCPFITIDISSKDEDACSVHIIGTEKTNSSFIVKWFHIGILYFKPSSKPFYSAIIPEHSLVGIYRAIKNNEYVDDYSCLLPLKYEKKYLELVIAEFGDWLHQQKMITKEERDA